MSKHFIPLAVAAALGLVPMAPAAELTRPIRFGTLETAKAETAQAQAAAWLKEVGKTDAATQAKFEAIWKDDAPVIEKVTRTFELGDPEAAKLMAAARDRGTLAPTETPALLKEANKNAFYRANLSLAFARALTQRAVHEEAMLIYKLIRPEQVIDPSAYLFHRAVSEHALLERDAALATINRLLDDVQGSPERYRTLAALMALDIHTWNEKDLGAIARKMKNVERRLELARGGPKTQKIQREIVARLDEMIKELENKNKNNSQCPNDGNCPGGSSGGPPKPGSGPPKGNDPSSPATESGITTQGGPGIVDQAKLKKLVENWGSLPPREQVRALQELTQGMSPRHREAIENYFRNLASAQNRK